MKHILFKTLKWVVLFSPTIMMLFLLANAQFINTSKIIVNIGLISSVIWIVFVTFPYLSAIDQYIQNILKPNNNDVFIFRGVIRSTLVKLIPLLTKYYRGILVQVLIFSAIVSALFLYGVMTPVVSYKSGLYYFISSDWLLGCLFLLIIGYDENIKEYKNELFRR